MRGMRVMQLKLACSRDPALRTQQFWRPLDRPWAPRRVQFTGTRRATPEVVFDAKNHDCNDTWSSHPNGQPGRAIDFTLVAYVQTQCTYPPRSCWSRYRQTADRLRFTGPPQSEGTRGSHCVDRHLAAQHAALSAEPAGPPCLGRVCARKGDWDIRPARGRQVQLWVNTAALRCCRRRTEVNEGFRQRWMHCARASASSGWVRTVSALALYEG